MRLINRIFSKAFLTMLFISIIESCFSFSSFADNNAFIQNDANKREASDTSKVQGIVTSPVEYINTNFENASPLYWEYNTDGSVMIKMLYDHERSSPNRASNHWHFQVQAKAGSDVTLFIQFFDEIWNGQKTLSYSLVKNYYVSQDGVNWTIIPAIPIENLGHKLQIHMESNSIFVAGMEPYRISDLDKLLADIKGNPLVEIKPIGKTVEGRQLEIIRIGSPDAPFRVFIRARAHPWEAGGNWVVQGLIRSLLDKKINDLPYLDRYCVYILPMANKDGVARGKTRFNSLGMDLNRGQERPADPYLSPENYALESWLKVMNDKGKKPQLSMDLHNDRNGQLSFGRPVNVDMAHYQSNTKLFEALMFKYTWYTWPNTNTSVKDTPKTDPLVTSRFDVNVSCTLELNQTWIAGLKKAPFGKDWELLGKELRDVFFYYFDDKK